MKFALAAVICVMSGSAFAQQVACQRVGNFVQCNDWSSAQSNGPYIYNQQQVPQQTYNPYNTTQNYQQNVCRINPYAAGCR